MSETAIPQRQIVKPQYLPRPEYHNGKVSPEHKALVDRDILRYHTQKARALTSEVERMLANAQDGVLPQFMILEHNNLKGVLQGYRFVTKNIFPRVFNDGIYDKSLEGDFRDYLKAVGELGLPLCLFGMCDTANVLRPLYSINEMLN